MPNTIVSSSKIHIDQYHIPNLARNSVNMRNLIIDLHEQLQINNQTDSRGVCATLFVLGGSKAKGKRLYEKLWKIYQGKNSVCCNMPWPWLSHSPKLQIDICHRLIPYRTGKIQYYQ